MQKNGLPVIPSARLRKTVLADYAPGYLYDTRRYMDGAFPRTPYGLIPIIPEWHTTRQGAILTDGDKVWVDGQPLDASFVRDELRHRFEAAAQKLPHG